MVFIKARSRRNSLLFYSIWSKVRLDFIRLLLDLVHAILYLIKPCYLEFLCSESRNFAEPTRRSPPVPVPRARCPFCPPCPLHAPGFQWHRIPSNCSPLTKHQSGFQAHRRLSRAPPRAEFSSSLSALPWSSCARWWARTSSSGTPRTGTGPSVPSGPPRGRDFGSARTSASARLSGSWQVPFEVSDKQEALNSKINVGPFFLSDLSITQSGDETWRHAKHCIVLRAWECCVSDVRSSV